MGFGKDGKGAIIMENAQIALSTLADATAIKQTSGGIGGNLQEDFRILKTEYSVFVEGGTQGEGPITIGLADNELSVAEIAECLDLNGPVDRNDRDGNEKATRPVWELVSLNAGDVDNFSDIVQRMEKKFRWTFSDAEGWTWFAYNDSGGTLTTGVIVRIRAKHFGVWVT